MNKRQLIVACVILFLSFAALYAEEGSSKLNKPASSTLAQEKALKDIDWEEVFTLYAKKGSELSKSASLTLAQKKAIKKIVDEDLGIDPHTTEVDLNKDGQKEVIVIYGRFPHHSNVEVIKFDGDKTNILFEEASNTPNIIFKIIKKIPTLIIEQSDYTPCYETGKIHKEIYQWDGKTFKLKSN